MLSAREDVGPIQLFRAGRDLRTRWEATFPTNRGHWRQILMWLSPNRRGYSWVGTFDDAVSSQQHLHHHFLLDGVDVGLESDRDQRATPGCSVSVEGVGQLEPSNVR